MKISELETKSFLGGQYVPSNSYILINYANGNQAVPATYKATLRELGKAIASDLHLYAYESSWGTVAPYTLNNNETNYIYGKSICNPNDTLVSTGYLTSTLNNYASTGYVTTAVSNLASVGYVDDALADLPAGEGAGVDLQSTYVLNESTLFPDIYTDSSEDLQVTLTGAHLVFMAENDTTGSPVLSYMDNYGYYVLNLGGPFYITNSSGHIVDQGRNIFIVDKDPEKQGKFFVMTQDGMDTEEIELAPNGTLWVDTSEGAPIGSLRYIIDGTKADLNLGPYIIEGDVNTTIDNSSAHLRPVMINTVDGKLYYHTNSSPNWHEITQQ